MLTSSVSTHAQPLLRACPGGLSLRCPRSLERHLPHNGGACRTTCKARRDERGYIRGPDDGNLGVLSHLTDQRTAEVADENFSVHHAVPSREGQFEPDGSNIAVSAVVLLLLVALTVERIFGLDKVLAAALRTWKEKRELGRRDESYAARQRFEKSWVEQSQDEGEPPSEKKR